MRRIFIIPLLMSLLLSTATGCRPEPVAPVLKQTVPVQTVALIHVSGMAPLVLPTLEQLGAIPRIGALRQTGVSGHLNGGVPVAFAGTTTSMLTGKTLKQQGVDFWFFLDPEKGVLHGYESGHIRVKLIQQMLAMRGLSSLTVFWPVTHPALPDAGEMVSPGPIPDRERIDDYAFVPDLTPGLPGRCSPTEMCRKVDSILANPESDQEILRRFLMEEDLSDPLAKAVKRDLIESYRADKAAMEILERRWTGAHRLVAVNLVGADLIGRRLYGQFDPKRFTIDKDRFQTLGRVLVAYYRFLDAFVTRVHERVGEQGVVILVSDHGIGPATPVDPDRGRMPGRAHPAGLCIISGAGVQAGRTGERFQPWHLTPLILHLLGQPLPEDGHRHINDRVLDVEDFVNQSTLSVPTYENGRPNPAPPRPFGNCIGDQERYIRFDELAPPLAH